MTTKARQKAEGRRQKAEGAKRRTWIIRWRHGYPDDSGRWCYAAAKLHIDGTMGWGAVIDQPSRAKRFVSKFAAMRWMLRRHAWPQHYIQCFRDRTWQLVPYGEELPLFIEREATG